MGRYERISIAALVLSVALWIVLLLAAVLAWVLFVKPAINNLNELNEAERKRYYSAQSDASDSSAAGQHSGDSRAGAQHTPTGSDVASGSRKAGREVASALPPGCQGRVWSLDLLDDLCVAEPHPHQLQADALCFHVGPSGSSVHTRTRLDTHTLYKYKPLSVVATPPITPDEKKAAALPGLPEPDPPRPGEWVRVVDQPRKGDLMLVGNRLRWYDGRSVHGRVAGVSTTVSSTLDRMDAHTARQSVACDGLVPFPTVSERCMVLGGEGRWRWPDILRVEQLWHPTHDGHEAWILPEELGVGQLLLCTRDAELPVDDASVPSCVLQGDVVQCTGRDSFVTLKPPRGQVALVVLSGALLQHMSDRAWTVLCGVSEASVLQLQRQLEQG